MNDLEREIESEIKNLKEMNRINSELHNLNSNLSNCLDLVSECASNPSINNRVDEMREECKKSYRNSKYDLEDRMEIAKKNISNLTEKIEEEKEKREKEEEKEEETKE
ncbi:MAG: hypothetical protein IJG68_08280 [Bacilli bacterium]|nr:hypothetical protein [Bacilli bacterium]